MPCGACREFLLELNAENKDAEFMMDYETRKQLKVAELIPIGGERNVRLSLIINRRSQLNWLFSFIFRISIKRKSPTKAKKSRYNRKS